MGWACSAYGGVERRIQNLVANPERKRTLVNPSRKWEDNIKVDVQEAGYACMDRIELVQVRDSWRELVGVVMNRRYP
jgi:uncharacterized protein YciU (UPF0263 family)